MQEMFTSFNAWKEKFRDRILDMGGQLKPGGTVVTASGAVDGPFVEDTGPGVPLWANERIFERFFRVDESRTRSAAGADLRTGTGLGLPIARWIAETQGGTVRLASSVARLPRITSRFYFAAVTLSAAAACAISFATGSGRDTYSA